MGFRWPGRKSTRNPLTRISQGAPARGRACRRTIEPALTSEVIVDNGGTGFSTTDTWSTTAFCCYYSSNYAYHKTNQPTPESIIDNGTAATSKTGTWSVYTATSQKIGANLEYKLTPDGTSTYTWTPSLAAAGQYRVYAYWYAWSGNATNAPYTIYYDGGSTTVQVNQRVNGGVCELSWGKEGQG